MGRERVNASCEWTHDAARPLDLHRSADAGHLREDATLAEDLAIRHADAARGHRSGHFAGTAAYVETRERCLDSLIATIATLHSVRSDQVRQRIGQRSTSFDVAVEVSFALLFVVASSTIAGWIVARVAESAIATLVGFAIAGPLVSAAGVMLFELWVSTFEMLRVGNTHMSYRVARLPGSHHMTALFVGGIVLFAATAVWRARRDRTSTAQPASALPIR
jgi:hypothetical protein